MYYLLTKSHCPLCTQALQLLYGLDIDEPLELTVVDIESDADLQQEYGWLVPVLKDQQDNELRWPFDQQQLLEFINL
ncbi:thioredoxin family protein [Idiomarina sp. OT37-5b]|jgi:glutaredoxin|uniref:Thioredoxin family protein n=1 Tax=Idiomarina aquatica TaxID=1327752 RepID=A0AA94JD62_9GAMM|nr:MULTISPECIES: glutaredoxin family protein [Idiomarina]AVJ55932.1 thioredoxin family protein [Idiomarina sp. OT37-5b]RUO43539.1 thioredoxin family protein [Idiomarina aquatica]